MQFKLSVNQAEDIESTIEFSKEVFGSDSKTDTKYHDPKNWKKKLDEGALLVCVSTEANELVAFCFCIPKEPALHVWLAGVKSSFRSKGIWHNLFHMIEHYALDNKFNQITLNTYKNKFPQMYNFCINHGFEQKSPPDKHGKTRFSLAIDQNTHHH